MTLQKAVDEKLIVPTSCPETYEFQVNLHFTDKQVSACGLSPTGVAAVFARNLSGLVRQIQKKMGLKLEQIKLSFQPE
jgi:hypothetical protein